MGCIGCAVLAFAVAADQAWFDRHFLPTFFLSRSDYLEIYGWARLAVAIVGAVIVLLRKPAASVVINKPAAAVSAALAVVTAFAASELMLRQKHFLAAEEVQGWIEPRRHLDDRFGWLFDPSRAGYQKSKTLGVTEYAFDRNGYRVRAVDSPVDFNLPTIIFCGESMMVGERLAWDDTIPAQAGRIVGVQSANIAVSGFASDQAFMRLQSELPRFLRPIAVVTLFAPGIFDRNLDDDRPHLGSNLKWMPAASRWRLTALFRRVVHYRSDDAIERGIVETREVFNATVALARARGGIPLIVVPQFGPELPRERELRRRILDEAGLDYVWVQLDPSWRVPNDGHPDARAAHAIAVAVAARLAPVLHASHS
ncbi:MAG TPA: hypothetical protein VGA10_13155 [Thermoanaerobaculia bacterium]